MENREINMNKQTLQKPRDYINASKKELNQRAVSDPYNVFYECEMRLDEIEEQDLDLIKASISSLESILDDINEHNCINLLAELGRRYSHEKLYQTLEERKAELTQAQGKIVTGMINIKTNPKARVFIKEKELGVTPLEKVVLPVGDLLLEFQCKETNKYYSKKVEIKENSTVIINTTYDEQQKGMELINEFNRQIENQPFSFTPTYFSFFQMLYDCEWELKESLEKLLEQGRLLSEERQESGTRRFIKKETESFSDGYYNVKYWEITNSGLEVKTQYGEVGTSSPRKNTKKHTSDEAAAKDFENKIKGKLKSGYEEEK